MSRLIALALIALLAACGVDGPPTPPVKDKPRSGITISGDARIGATATL
jgi:predicted small lipoprotein YifL